MNYIIPRLFILVTALFSYSASADQKGNIYNLSSQTQLNFKSDVEVLPNSEYVRISSGEPARGKLEMFIQLKPSDSYRVLSKSFLFYKVSKIETIRNGTLSAMIGLANVDDEGCLLEMDGGWSIESYKFKVGSGEFAMNVYVTTNSNVDRKKIPSITQLQEYLDIKTPGQIVRTGR